MRWLKCWPYNCVCVCVAREWKDKSTQCLPTMRLLLLLLTFHTLTPAHCVCDGFCVIYSRSRLLLFIPHSSFILCVFREDVIDLDDPVLRSVYLIKVTIFRIGIIFGGRRTRRANHHLGTVVSWHSGSGGQTAVSLSQTVEEISTSRTIHIFFFVYTK